MTNPYQSPTARPETTASARPPILRLPLFLINFSVTVLFAIVSIIGIIVRESLAAFVGGLILIGPLMVYAVCEWLAFYRSQRSVERKLGYANFGLAAFAAFAVISNIGEALWQDDQLATGFVIRFGLVGAAIIAYLVASGWYRLQWTRPTTDAVGAAE